MFCVESISYLLTHIYVFSLLHYHNYNICGAAGLESDLYPNQFVVIDEDMPCYTEPFWRNIGLRVYPQASVSILVVALVVGLTVIILRFVL